MRNWLVGASMLLAGAAYAETVGGGQMIHCPTAVKGAKVEVKDAKEGVEITVTGDEAEIRKRAKHVADASKADPTSVQHTGDGHGGGGLGHCVVVLKDTVVTTEDVPGGAKLTVKPVKPVDLEWLKKETKDRQASKAVAKKKK